MPLGNNNIDIDGRILPLLPTTKLARLYCKAAGAPLKESFFIQISLSCIQVLSSLI